MDLLEFQAQALNIRIALVNLFNDLHGLDAFSFLTANESNC